MSIRTVHPRWSRVLAAVALLAPAQAGAATLAVPTVYATVQDAVNAAVDGDEVFLNPGDYSGEGLVDLAGKDLTITGSGVGLTTLPAFSGDTVTLTVQDATLPCTERAIEVLDAQSSTTISNVEASGCVLGEQLIVVEGSLVLQDATFDTMTTEGVGVLLASSGDHLLERVTFRDVTSTEPPAPCDPVVDGCSVAAAGAMLFTNLEVRDSSFEGCTANDAACLYVWGYHSGLPIYGTVTLTGVTVEGAAAGADVISIADFAEANLTGLEVVGNTATAGGIVVFDASMADLDAIVTVRDSRFEGNSTAGDAAPLEIRGSQASLGENVLMERSAFCGNTNATGPSDLLVDSVDDAFVSGVAFALGDGVSSAEVRSADGRFTNVTFAGHGGDAVVNTLATMGSSAELTNVLVADVAGYASNIGAGSTAWGEYLGSWSTGGWSNVLADAAFDAYSVQADPQFVAYTDRFTSTCATIDLRLAVGSPMRDAGDPAITDLDGTVSDIGAYGGPLADLVDGDLDGVYEDLDCDDALDTVFPGAPEVPYDGVDQDCDGADVVDVDGDGEASDLVGGPDCDDADPAINTSAAEIWYDGVDQDCDGADDYDQDGDGDPSDQFGGGDCDDLYAEINSLADEVWYDGVDSDCDGADDYDQDGDGFASDQHGGIDCDDENADIEPGGTEIWYDGVDQDCDGRDDDQDRDGFPLAEDCDDEDANRNPDAPDPSADGVDQDCDGIDGPPDTVDPEDTDDGDGGGSGGCGCSAAPTPAGGWLALAPVLALALRRRR